MTDPIDLERFLSEARSWLDDHVPRQTPRGELGWGEGSDRVALFRNLTAAEESALVGAARLWQQTKSDAGYGSISWPVEFGGRSLPTAFDDAFRQLESTYVTPPSHEAVRISMNMVTPTILTLGTEMQAKRYVESFRRTDEICCQCFSEPGAGSDLGAMSTSAVRDGDKWVINGQKVWTSAAGHANFAYVITRTDRDAPRQQAMTAFLVDMKSPGVEVRPLKQMTGGSSFNEIFFTDVEVDDDQRLGGVGAGWSTAMTTLGFERSAGTRNIAPDYFEVLTRLARHLGRHTEPVLRQGLAQLYIDSRLSSWTSRRGAEALRAGGIPGAEGSIGKLGRTSAMRKASALASHILGPRLAADTGEWGTFSWSEFVNSEPGAHIGGGTDEIQRNTIAERALGLPREPR